MARGKKRNTRNKNKILSDDEVEDHDPIKFENPPFGQIQSQNFSR